MTEKSLEITVNEHVHRVEAEPETPLVYVLRNDLGLKGVRSGCGIGVCGSCTVLADGEPLRACVTPVSAVLDVEVTTPEGLGTPDRPHAIQEAFLAEQAAQCGYCVNGIIMSAAARAGRDDGAPASCPEWLTEHLCRCGTHPRLRRAIDRVASRSGEAKLPSRMGESATASGAVPAEAAAPAQGGAPAQGHAHDRVESWIRLLPDGRVEARTGKVEIGQGIQTAIGQIVAAQVGIPLDQLVVVPTTTSQAPDEAYTAGSNSVDRGGATIARAAVAFRRLLLERAGDHVDALPEDLSIRNGCVVTRTGVSVPLTTLAADGDVTGQIEATDAPDWRAAPIGESIARDDLLPKLTGAPAFVHDLALPQMVHVRALLPPSRHAERAHLDVSGAQTMPGVVKVIEDDRLILVIAEREEQAVRATSRLRRSATWGHATTGTDSANLFESMRAWPVHPYVAREADDPLPPADHRATYSVPYQAHAAIAPSCAVAVLDGDVMRVWTHSQGVHPLRRALAGLLDVEVGQIEVNHRAGPGCYGYNLADDAAAFAALAAQEVPGRPVRFQFTVEDEFGWEPYGPATIADLEASLGGGNRIGHWSHRSLSDTSSTRPHGDADRLMPGWLGSKRREPSWPGPTEAAARNAEPIYDIQAVAAVADHVQGPLRTGQLRAPGSYLNTFASESFMDEIANLAWADPLDFRHRHLSDERARAVLDAAAETIGWIPRAEPSGRGLGLAMTRFKLTKAYVAVAIQAAVDSESAQVSVQRLVIACDAGTVINPDGLGAQLEGGALQGISRAIHEEIKFDRTATVTSTDWLSYPVIGFDEVPDIEVVLVNSVGEPPLGAGEASVGPAAAALANALDDFLGVRFRELPLTPGRIRQRLTDLDEREAERVLLA